MASEPSTISGPSSLDGEARAAVGLRRTWLLRGRIMVGALLLASCLAVSVEAWSGVAYLAGLHEHLGRGPWAALAAIWVLCLSILVPPAAWLFWPALERIASLGWRAWALVLMVVSLGLALVSLSYLSARAVPTRGAVEHVSDGELERALSSLGDVAGSLPPPPERSPSLLTAAPASCSMSPSERTVTLVATFADRGTHAPAGACFQDHSLGAALAAVRAALLERAERGPVQLEVSSGSQRLSSRHSWLDLLKLRPGLDGVCLGGKCLMPWQLLAYGFFSSHRPLHFIPDLQFGVAPERLREAVGAVGQAGVSELVRLTTRSYVLDLSSTTEPLPLTPLVRMRRREVPLTQGTLERAENDAEGHVLLAQQADGKFRYTLDPFTGKADTSAVNLARQAGTMLVLCELGSTTVEVQRAIELGLGSFEQFVRRRGELLALASNPDNPVARLGESALPLVSLLSCATREGVRLAPSVPGLTQYILALQRDDGGFAPALDLQSGAVSPGPEPLYAAGQAVMALVLLEQRQQVHPSDALPSYDVLHDAVERAMSHVALRYWSHPLRDFFFMEENWHCLAARAALGVHRNPGYEDFCIDYVRFKSRLILFREEGVDADFDGGFGFGNIIPPHNTGAAGFGEALAAAIAILGAQDKPTTKEQALLGRVMGFLLRQQWSRENCFACATPEVIGGMSEHTHSAVTRIDFAQHAWAALGHGRRVLAPWLPPD